MQTHAGVSSSTVQHQIAAGGATMGNNNEQKQQNFQ